MAPTPTSSIAASGEYLLSVRGRDADIVVSGTERRQR
jgi:hypothetical protein